MKPSRPLIAAHGGAGRPSLTGPQKVCLADALAAGYDLLRQGGSALEAVEATIRFLEASGLFNAGVGARLQLDGMKRMDASIMEGRGLMAGAVAAIEDVRHPITVAKFVMQETGHVLLVGPPATRFARHYKLERQLSPQRASDNVLSMPTRRDRQAKKTLTLFMQMQRRTQSDLETVGAVALDEQGTVAAGASTGGVAVMLPGRVGDTPLIGCGVYADNMGGAVSMTGIGEGIIRIGVAKEIVDRLAGGATPAVAARLVLKKLASRLQGSAGVLVLTPAGRFAIRHTTPHMAAGYWRGKGRPIVADHFGL
ncbi:MAG: isoaspartyl peptidase/L-asparaginase family protein [Nitrospiraceae bacterium]